MAFKPLTLPYCIPIAFVNGRWQADLIAHRKIVDQLRREAKLPGAWPDAPDAYDKILEAAGRHTLGLQTEEPT